MIPLLAAIALALLVATLVLLTRRASARATAVLPAPAPTRGRPRAGSDAAVQLAAVASQLASLQASVLQLAQQRAQAADASHASVQKSAAELERTLRILSEQWDSEKRELVQQASLRAEEAGLARAEQERLEQQCRQAELQRAALAALVDDAAKEETQLRARIESLEGELASAHAEIETLSTALATARLSHLELSGTLSTASANSLTLSQVLGELSTAIPRPLPFVFTYAHQDEANLKRLPKGKAKQMEDYHSLLLSPSSAPFPSNLSLVGQFCIYDGHGGIYTARDACVMFPSLLASALSLCDESSLAETLTATVLQLDSSLRAAQKTEVEICSGTTLSFVCLLQKGENYSIQCGNVGDSSIVIFYPSSNSSELLSHDHKCTDAAERDRLVSHGYQPTVKRIVGLAVSRTIGDFCAKDNEPNKALIAIPSLSPLIAIDKECVVIVASDGLWDAFPRGNFVQDARDTVFSNFSAGADAIAAALLEFASAKSNDNISLTVLCFHASK